MQPEIQKCYKAAFSFYKQHEHAQTSEDFKLAAEKWLRLDGLTADIAAATLRHLERRVFGGNVYNLSEVDKAYKNRVRYRHQADYSVRRDVGRDKGDMP